MMLALGQAAAPTNGGAAAAAAVSLRRNATLNSINPKPLIFSTRCKPKFVITKRKHSLKNLTLAKPDDAVDTTTPATKQPQTQNQSVDNNANQIQFVSQENVPLEGVIQFEKNGVDFSQRISKWGRVALFAGGDVLALLLFSAIGRFSHGFPVFDYETLRSADPFIAGWFLSAYFLGGYGEDGRGMNGWSKGVVSAAKSWALGIPLGLVIRATISGHVPPYNFILVTMGSTAVLLLGWRAILLSVLPGDKRKKSDMYRQGSPFELFELLTSLVRRW